MMGRVCPADLPHVFSPESLPNGFRRSPNRP